ncbi:hypothetical protein ACQ4N7_29805 [Nodosilinea sp. AN01ver1]|uniref:hypothetical protein n=1 Tax=Nodosilinea sp. AN01ver1 TaxID=3423362 RepID=UPI003D31E96D
MADLDLNNQSTDAIAPESVSAAASRAVPGLATASTSGPAQEASSAPMTNAQAEQVLAELKTIKQNLLWILLLGGFFAARAFFFHY